MNRSSAFYFQQFAIEQDQCAMKIGLDSVLLGAWVPIVNPKRILDIGTGTGILSLMMAQRSKAIIDAVEIDERAFQQAKCNIKESKFHKQIVCFNTSIQDFDSTSSYDVIISNPPYFEKSLKSGDKARDTARHNDQLSLDDLFSRASQLLAPQGILAFILPYSSLEQINTRAKKYAFFISHITEVKGRKHKNPNRILICLQKEETKANIKSLTVYDEEGKYTADFQALTKDFYLPSTFR